MLFLVLAGFAGAVTMKKQVQTTAMASLTLGFQESTEYYGISFDMNGGVYSETEGLATELDPTKGPLFMFAHSDGYARFEFIANSKDTDDPKTGLPHYLVEFQSPAEPTDADKVRSGVDRADVDGYVDFGGKSVKIRTLAHTIGVNADQLAYQLKQFKIATYLGNNRWSIEVPFRDLDVTIAKLRVGVIGILGGHRRDSVNLAFFKVTYATSKVRDSFQLSNWVPVVDNGPLKTRKQFRAGQVVDAEQFMQTGSVAAVSSDDTEILKGLWANYTYTPTISPTELSGLQKILAPLKAQVDVISATEVRVSPSDLTAALRVYFKGNPNPVTVPMASGNRYWPINPGNHGVERLELVKGEQVLWLNLPYGAMKSKVTVEPVRYQSGPDSEGYRLLLNGGSTWRPGQFTYASSTLHDGNVVHANPKKVSELMKEVNAGRLEIAVAGDDIHGLMAVSGNGDPTDDIEDSRFPKGTPFFVKKGHLWEQTYAIPDSTSARLVRGREGWARDSCGNWVKIVVVEYVPITITLHAATAFAPLSFTFETPAQQIVNSVAVNNNITPVSYWTPVGFQWGGLSVSGKTTENTVQLGSIGLGLFWSGSSWMCGTASTVCPPGGSPTLPVVPPTGKTPPVDTPPNPPQGLPPVNGPNPQGGGEIK